MLGAWAPVGRQLCRPRSGHRAGEQASSLSDSPPPAASTTRPAPPAARGGSCWEHGREPGVSLDVGTAVTGQAGV